MPLTVCRSWKPCLPAFPNKRNRRASPLCSAGWRVQRCLTTILTNPNPPFDSSKPLNPYITVDYMENVPTYDGVQYDVTGTHTFTPYAQRHSWGKKEPYAGWGGALIQDAARPRKYWQQQPNNGRLTNQPQHTFFEHNYVEFQGSRRPRSASSTAGQTLRIPFDWLVQLDRQAVSPIELLQVSGFRPHELTQQFVAPPYYTTSQTNVAIRPRVRQ